GSGREWPERDGTRRNADHYGAWNLGAGPGGGARGRRARGADRARSGYRFLPGRGRAVAPLGRRRARRTSGARRARPAALRRRLAQVLRGRHHRARGSGRAAARLPGGDGGRGGVETLRVGDEIASVAGSLAERRIGALIVIERGTGLRQYAELGVALDALVSADLLTSLFLPYSPLHDGAAFIRDERVIAAG